LDWESDSDASWLFGAAPANAGEKIIDLALEGLQMGNDDAFLILNKNIQSAAAV
jgi:hypothetical protein